MTNLERAKQFMPFAALRGYEEVIEGVASVYQPKIDLSDDEKEEISNVLIKIKKGDMCKINYYAERGYKTITGLVSLIDIINKKITIIKTPIPFEEIKEIEIL